MRFSAEALAIVSALLWGASVLLVGLINLAAPSYGPCLFLADRL